MNLKYIIITAAVVIILIQLIQAVRLVNIYQNDACKWSFWMIALKNGFTISSKDGLYEGLKHLWGIFTGAHYKLVVSMNDKFESMSDEEYASFSQDLSDLLLIAEKLSHPEVLELAAKCKDEDELQLRINDILEVLNDIVAHPEKTLLERDAIFEYKINRFCTEYKMDKKVVIDILIEYFNNLKNLEKYFNK